MYFFLQEFHRADVTKQNWRQRWSGCGQSECVSGMKNSEECDSTRVFAGGGNRIVGLVYPAI